MFFCKSVSHILLHHPARSQAVNAYQRLAALLRGEYPPGLLPPAPQGYVVARIRELAGAWGTPWLAGRLSCGPGCAACVRAPAPCLVGCLIIRPLCLHGQTRACRPSPPPTRRPQRAAAWRHLSGTGAASGAASLGARSCPPTQPCSSTFLHPTWQRRSGCSRRYGGRAAGRGVLEWGAEWSEGARGEWCGALLRLRRRCLCLARARRATPPQSAASAARCT